MRDRAGEELLRRPPSSSSPASATTHSCSPPAPSTQPSRSTELAAHPAHPPPMASTQHPHSRYHPGPAQRLDSDVRLPSLKDLNFQYRSPQTGPLVAPPPSADPHPAQVQRDHGGHAWGARQTSASVFAHPAHQQHSPPLSAGAHHDVAQPTKAADYPTQKHDNGGYAHPGLPLSAQLAPASTSFSTVAARTAPAPPFQDRDKQVHSPVVQTKRPRATPTMSSASRDARAPHSAYAYSSYPQSSQTPSYHQQQQQPQHVSSGVTSLPSNTHQTQTPVMPTQSSAPPPPTHDQIHTSQQPQQAVPVASHAQYSYPTHQYFNSRGQPVSQQQQQHQPQSQTSHAAIPSSYRSPNPHPVAPSPAQQSQGPWAQQQHHLQQTQHGPPPPSASQIQPQHQQSQQHISSLQQQQQQPPAQRIQQQPTHQQAHISQQPPPQQPQQQHTHIHPHSMHYQPPPGTSLPTTAAPYSLVHHTPAQPAPPPLPQQPPQQPQSQPSQYSQQQQQRSLHQPAPIQHQSSQNSQHSQPQQPPPRYEDAPPQHSQHVPQHQQHQQQQQHAQPPQSQHIHPHQSQHQQQHPQHQQHQPAQPPAHQQHPQHHQQQPPPQQQQQHRHQQPPPFPATRSTPIIPTTVVINTHQQAPAQASVPPPPSQPPHSHSYAHSHSQASTSTHPPAHPSAPPPPYVSPGAESMMEVDVNSNAPSGSGPGVNGVAVGVNPNSVNGANSGAMNVARSETLAQLNQHCAALYSFASRYASQNQHQHQHQQSPQPSQAELEEMAQRAQLVLRLLEDLRRINMGLLPTPPMPMGAAMQAPNGQASASGQGQQSQQQHGGGGGGQQQQQHGQPMHVATPPEDPRPPKRPWEDISQDGPDASASHHQSQGRTNGTGGDGHGGVNGSASHGGGSISSAGGDGSGGGGGGGGASKGGQSTAEQDMELIRTKRATTTAGATGAQNGVQKSKYRKRSRATPPGKCHSCNIRETPEWRRGPDGARTLCNACGLHYAKLMRKRDKNGGEGPRIDLETLRASARAIDTEKSNRNKGSAAAAAAPSRSRQGSVSTPDSPMDTKEGLATSQPLQHNQMYTPESYSQQQQQRAPQHHHQGSFQLTMVPADTAGGSSAGGSGGSGAGGENGARNGATANGAANGVPVGRTVSTTNGPGAGGNVPPPPWASSAANTGAGGRPTYASANGPSGTEHLQHQSFMRAGGAQR